MPTTNSNLVTRRTRNRATHEGVEYKISGRILVPNGTVVTTSNDFLFVPVGENQVIKKVTLLVLGDSSTIAGSIGTFQQLDNAGAVVVIERKGPNGETSTKYTSPATSAAALRAAGQLDGYTETVLATPARLAGPTNVGIRITTGGTFAAETEMILEVTLVGDHGTIDVESGYPSSYPDLE